MGFSTLNDDHLIRSNLWSSDLKEVLEGELLGMGFVKMLSDFPDGDTLNIPSIGQAEVLDYTEGQAIRYTAMDTGNFTFTIDQYKSSATYITNKMKQDSYVMSELMASFVPRQSRAIMVAMENLIMSIGPDAQTAADLNAINGASHRFVGGGASGIIAIADFARAKYSLDKAFVPSANRIAIVDPSVEYELNKTTNLVSVSNNPKWEGIISTGMSTGMRFVANVYGFDVYVSNYLKGGYAETINSVAVTAGVANLFFSAAPDVLPFVGHIRQAPKVDSSYNKDLQRDEYVTTCRYGFKLFRPENLVVVLTAVTTI